MRKLFQAFVVVAVFTLAGCAFDVGIPIYGSAYSDASYDVPYDDPNLGWYIEGVQIGIEWSPGFWTRDTAVVEKHFHRYRGRHHHHFQRCFNRPGHRRHDQGRDGRGNRGFEGRGNRGSDEPRREFRRQGNYDSGRSDFRNRSFERQRRHGQNLENPVFRGSPRPQVNSPRQGNPRIHNPAPRIHSGGGGHHRVHPHRSK